MAMQKFGTVDGQDVFQITLHLSSGFEAKILNWGAVLRDLIVPTAKGPQSVVLGLNSMEDYLAHSPHFGATPGRFANRIGNASFEIDNRRYDLTPNKGSKHCLHGGPNGYGKRVWQVGVTTDRSVELHLHSPDGDAGFPGNVEASCLYELVAPSVLRIELTAHTDAPTPVNLTHHSYFNLDGSADARDHEVQLLAGFYTPTDADLIPTGEIRAVAGGPYDFSAPRPVRNAAGQTYDTNFVGLKFPDASTGLAHLASLRSPKNGLIMEVYSSEQGVQFYDAAKLDCPVQGLGGAHYGAHAGLCFEPQNFPDAPNKRHFPNSILRPGETYHHKIEYRFI